MRITSARDQVELLAPWTNHAVRRQAGRLQLPHVPSKILDSMGLHQDKINENTMSWMSSLSDDERAKGSIWYPTGNQWGAEVADRHGQHPDKVYGSLSKTSPQREWYGNMDDTDNIVGNHRDNPRGIMKPPGISGTDNLKQALRVMGAEDHPDAIHAAFLGTKNVNGRQVAKTPKDLPKTHDFFLALRDPEHGGAGNYMHQPAVIDSWQSRAGLWNKDEWDNRHETPLTWPGQGTGEGLDRHLPVKKKNAAGQYEVVGSKPPTAKDVAARVTSMGGGYDRLRNSVRNAASEYDMPFAHGAQAAVWRAISGNSNPDEEGFPHHKMTANGQRWNEIWHQRASGLAVPSSGAGPGGLHMPPGRAASLRTAAHGSMFDPPEDSLDEGWGGPGDIRAILRHVSQMPPGYDHFASRPGVIGLGHHPGIMGSRYDRELLSYVDGLLDV